MDKESLYKLGLMLGGGFLAFLIIKSIMPLSTPASASSTSTNTKSYSGDGVTITDKDKENAEIVMMAYVMAMQNGEDANTLATLNKETMNEFGLRCYQTKSGEFVVANKTGAEVLKA